MEMSRTRIPALDGLRGAAVIGVVAFHYWPDTVPGGFVGVSLFFTLSGFLIGSLAQEELSTTGTINPAAFWSRRVRRLLPAASVTIASVLVATAILRPDDLRQVANDAFASIAYFANWRTAARPGGYEALFDTAIRPLDHFWSLSIEEQFYVVGPLLLPIRTRILLPSLLIITVAGTVVWWGSPDSYYATPVRLGEIAMGLGIARLWSKTTPGRGATVAGVFALAGLIAVSLTWSTSHSLVSRGGLLGVAVLSAVCIRAALNTSPLTTALAHPLLVWTGRRSYGIYLIHWPIIELTSWPPLVAAVVSLLLAEISWRVVESPVLAVRGWGPAVVKTSAATAALALVAGLVIVWPSSPAPTVADFLNEPIEATTPTIVATAPIDATDANPEQPTTDVVTDTVPPDVKHVLVYGDSQAVVVGAGLVEWAATSQEYSVEVIGIRGCPGLLFEGWATRFDQGESGDSWPAYMEGCRLPSLPELIAETPPDIILIAEWGTATLDFLSPTTGEWTSVLDREVREAWSDRYTRLLTVAEAEAISVGFLTGPPCGRVAPCSEDGRIEAYNAVLSSAGLPVLDLQEIFASAPDRYPTADGAHIEEGAAAFLLAAEVIHPFVELVAGS
jgi:peptidoglycan/LPS O-acetylase OafA/YrhL